MFAAGQNETKSRYRNSQRKDSELTKRTDTHLGFLGKGLVWKVDAAPEEGHTYR